MSERKTKPITVSRRYPAAPLVGVGVVVLNGQGEVLLIKRGKPPRAGEWSLPGGLIDLGERLEDAARREVQEECGITIAIGGFVATFEPIIYDAAGEIEYHYVLIDYWATHLAGEAVAQDDAMAVSWSPVEQLAGFMLRSETQRVILTAHAAWRAANAEGR
ncbi:MAG: NUDIX domain-containing protein [Caldilinea sp. CFX5]|nr:NUDIX domain-containing protein [Caldilinea sp. CFX5]